jgi:S-adenosylmethionine:tRNA ribosyltransferase-isomerase
VAPKEGLGDTSVESKGSSARRIRTSAFDFDLPESLIAQHPVEPRDRSRLLVLRRGSGAIAHHIFSDLPALLAPGDLLVRNNTRVVPARLLGHREKTRGKWEGLFLRVVPETDCWEILATTRGKPRAGESVIVSREGEDALRFMLVSKGEGGYWTVRPESTEPPDVLLERFGHLPLPPYIRHGREEPGDRSRYQTVFAQVPGSAAAPTAGLHFTDEVFAGLSARGVGRCDVTLHVGPGTFRPIEAERIEDHVLHSEWAELPIETALALNAARARGGRIVAVGTTSARTLETAALASGDEFRPFQGETALYLRPGHQFRAVDALITNFHLPRSSLIVLVSAFAGVEHTRAAYAEAVRERYRFYSYGDAMLIL